MKFSAQLFLEFCNRCIISNSKVSLLTPGGFIIGYLDTSYPYENIEKETESFSSFMKSVKDDLLKLSDSNEEEINEVILLHNAKIYSGRATIECCQLFINISEIIAFSSTKD